MADVQHTKPYIPNAENPDGWGADGTHSVGCAGCMILGLQDRIDRALAILENYTDPDMHVRDTIAILKGES